MAKPLLLVERDGYVHRIVFNRPDKRNAFDTRVLTGLIEALSDRTARTYILSGAGGSFSVGWELFSGSLSWELEFFWLVFTGLSLPRALQIESWPRKTLCSCG